MALSSYSGGARGGGGISAPASSRSAAMQAAISRAAQQARLAAAIRAVKAASASKIPKGTTPAPSPTQLYQAAGISAPAANAAFRAGTARNAAANQPSSGGSTYSAPSYSAPAAAPPPAPVPQTAFAAPAPPPPVPVTANAGAGAQNVEGASFTTQGGVGTSGMFERQRQARGPRTGTSITPEMLMRISRQRISNQR